MSLKADTLSWAMFASRSFISDKLPYLDTPLGINSWLALALNKSAPQSEAETLKRLIVHQPSQVWEYDGNKLIIGVVASCLMAGGGFYLWYRNGSQFKEGHKCCFIPVNDTGLYCIEVQYRTEMYLKAYSVKLLRGVSLSQPQRKVQKKAVHVHLIPTRQKLFPSCPWFIKRRSHFL